MVQDRTIVTMADLIESHTRSIEPRHFNDLERPQTQISRSGHSLTLNISEMVKDTAIVIQETVPKI